MSCPLYSTVASCLTALPFSILFPVGVGFAADGHIELAVVVLLSLNGEIFRIGCSCDRGIVVARILDLDGRIGACGVDCIVGLCEGVDADDAVFNHVAVLFACPGLVDIDCAHVECGRGVGAVAVVLEGIAEDRFEVVRGFGTGDGEDVFGASFGGFYIADDKGAGSGGVVGSAGNVVAFDVLGTVFALQRRFERCIFCGAVEKENGLSGLVVPDSGDAADFEVVAVIVCIDELNEFSGADDVDEFVAVMCDSGNAADIAGGADDVDVGDDVHHRLVAFAHEADDSANVGSIFLGIGFDIASGVRVDCEVGQVGISVFAEHVADVGIAADFDVAGQLDVGVFGGVGAACDNADVEITDDVCIVEGQVFDFPVCCESEKPEFTLLELLIFRLLMV